MKLNSPLPQSLPKECAKAAKIFKSFVDSGNNGLDGVIPRAVLENAKGFAIFTIFKAGFLFSARAGSGIVIARLPDGSWSAPSAIGTAGLGVGGQAGAEMTDFLIVLNSRSAIQSFMAAGSLSLGGNMSLALGPLGRNGEAIGSLNTSGKVAAMYSYSKTRGLFGGLSIEGSVIVERQDANTIAYNSPVTVKLLLGGTVEPPPWASPLIQTLEACTGLPGGRKWVQDNAWGETPPSSYAFGEGMASPGAEPSAPSYLRKKKKGDKPAFPPASWGKNKDSGSYFHSDHMDEPGQAREPWDQPNSSATANFQTRFDSDFAPESQARRHSRFSASVSHTSSNDLLDSPNTFEYQSSSMPKLRPRSPHSRSKSMASPVSSSSGKQDMKAFSFPTPAANPFTRTGTPDEDDIYVTYPSRSDRSLSYSAPYIAPKPELTRPLLPHEGVARAIALYDFQAVESGDLSFSKGDIIVITQKSESSNDWWTGKIQNRQGVFPANFVEVV